MFHFSQTVFKKIAIALALLPVLLLAPGGRTGGDLRAESSGAQIRKLKKKAADVDRKREEKEAAVRAFSQKEADIIDSLNEADLSLNHARKQAAASRSALRALEKRIASARSDSEALALRIRETERYAADRMVRLYKLGNLGEIHMLASADSVNDFLRRKTALERILQYDNAVVTSLARQRRELGELMAWLDGQTEKKQALREQHQKQLRLLNHQQAQRKKLLQNIREKKSLARAALAALKQSASRLDRTIRALEAAPPSGEIPKGKGRFAAFKGLLNMPVKGKIIAFFGPYKNREFGVMNFRSGINIRAERGAPVRSVCAGRTIYASWLKGYGNMIIIDHGDHYYTLYAHAEELLKASGAPVETGEVIATVGDSGSVNGPGLHFEVRHHGKPIDPLHWLRKG